MADETAMKGIKENLKLHIVLVPLMAPGHMIPMVDIACLLAERGTLVSFIITPLNAARINTIIDYVKDAGLPIHFVELEFPCTKAGLPQGCENMDLLPPNNLSLFISFFKALSLLRQPLELYLRETNPSPNCIIADFCQPWTMEVAREFKIPRLVFHGPSCFSILSAENIRRHKVYESVANEFETVTVPDLPQRIEITRAQSPGWFPTGMEKISDSAIEAETTADGILFNSFKELELEYIEHYQKMIEKKVWTIGPLFLYNKDAASKANRGNKSSINEHQVLGWLDSMEPRSVIFVCFGSLVLTQATQLIEIGCGLEASNRPFIWVIKEAERITEVEKWMSQGFEERTRERSFIITGWAPQVVILSHPAIGGFITHCGWNSMLEAVSTAVPMITWPFFADQFLNEKLIVEVLKIGISLGVKVPIHYVKEKEILGKRDDVEKAVVSLMDRGKEGKERRERARQYGKNARKAMEVGGSSYENLTLLIQHIQETTSRMRE